MHMPSKKNKLTSSCCRQIRAQALPLWPWSVHSLVTQAWSVVALVAQSYALSSAGRPESSLSVCRQGLALARPPATSDHFVGRLVAGGCSRSHSRLCAALRAKSAVIRASARVGVATAPSDSGDIATWEVPSKWRAYSRPLALGCENAPHTAARLRFPRSCGHGLGLRLSGGMVNCHLHSRPQIKANRVLRHGM